LKEVMMNAKLRKEHYGCAWASNVVTDMQTGVETLHSIGMIHGDIKMENVVYDPESDQSKIIDFDGACIFNVRTGDMIYPVGDDMCRLKTTPGSTSHMRLEDPAHTPSIEDDLFRVGMIVYTLITQEEFCVHEESKDTKDAEDTKEPCSWEIFMAHRHQLCGWSHTRLGEEQRSGLPIAVKRALRKLNMPTMHEWDTESWISTLKRGLACHVE
jgi:serine/threonine protein kinase